MVECEGACNEKYESNVRYRYGEKCMKQLRPINVEIIPGFVC